MNDLVGGSNEHCVNGGGEHIDLLNYILKVESTRVAYWYICWESGRGKASLWFIVFGG